MKRLLRVVAVTAALSIVVPASALAANTAVIADPFTPATSDSQHATAVEPDTFAFGSTLVVTSQVGRFFDGGASSTAFATSVDGGATWGRESSGASRPPPATGSTAPPTRSSPTTRRTTYG